MKMKAGQVLCSNKTRSKLKQTVSTLMNPFSGTVSLNPASQPAQMWLADCTNLSVSKVTYSMFHQCSVQVHPLEKLPLFGILELTLQ